MVEATRRASEIQDQLDALQPDDGDTLQQARDVSGAARHC